MLLVCALAAGTALASPIVISAVYKDFSDLSQFTLNGNTIANNPGGSGVNVGGQKVLRITQASRQQSGSAFLTKRVSLVGGRSFSTYFSFQIGNSGGDFGIPGADGLVFVVQTKANNVGATGGGIGYLGVSPSVGVEFDTWKNDESYAQDPNNNHVGINVNGDSRSVKTANPPGDLKSGIWNVWVDYNGNTKNMEVRVVQNSTTRPATPLLTQTLDLQQILNMDEVYIGFTSATGLGWGNHDIRSFYFNNDYTPIDPTDDYIPAPTQVDVSANPTSVSAGQSSTITAVVKDSKNNIVPNHPVTFTTTLGTITQTALTDANGVATATLTSAAIGSAKVKASAIGGAYGETTVQFVNTPPVASDSSVPALEDQVSSGTLSANDADGDPLTYSLVSGPMKGSVSVNPSGQFTYTPNADENGTDSFTFKANDGKIDSNTATVHIAVSPINDAPSFVKGADQAANKKAAGSKIAVPGWASQISSGPVNESGQTVAFDVAADLPALFVGQPAIDANGTLSFTPADNISGKANVSVVLRDNGGTANGGIDTSAQQSFDIRVDSINPTITAVLNPSGWTNGNVTVNAAFDGTGSDITVTKWDKGSKTAADFQTGGSALNNGAFTVSENGTYSVYAQDAAGNETVQLVQVGNIDTIAPVTAAAANPVSANGSSDWYTSEVTVSLSATDDMSGVAKTEYRVNDGAWTVYNGSVPPFSDGVYKLDYRSVDRAGNTEATKTLNLKVDTSAPVVQVTVDQPVLWSPNHKLVDIVATVSANDGTAGIASIVLTSITSSDPDNGTGDGDTANDVQGAEFGTNDMSFSLRAERSGKNPAGRVYTITYTITDTAGNVTTATATVSVNHDNSQKDKKQ
ncbi:Ig-like domain-containing protein [Paenibacillus sp. HJGM_3]